MTCMLLLLHVNIDLGSHWRIYDSDGLTNHGGKAKTGLLYLEARIEQSNAKISNSTSIIVRSHLVLYSNQPYRGFVLRIPVYVHHMDELLYETHWFAFLYFW